MNAAQTKTAESFLRSGWALKRMDGPSAVLTHPGFNHFIYIYPDGQWWT